MYLESKESSRDELVDCHVGGIGEIENYYHALLKLYLMKFSHGILGSPFS